MNERGLLYFACVLVALLFFLLWLLSATGTIGGIPAWMPPSGGFAAALALALGGPPRPAG
jgi:hypothetical protein